MNLIGHIFSIGLLVTFITGATGNFCFRNRNPSGSLGQCHDRIPNKNTASACCRAGGAGWTTKRSGKRCGPACSGDETNTAAPEEEPTTTQPPAEATDHFCFRNRDPSGSLGQCHDRIPNKNTAAACCRAGGAGWTTKSNGKRCGPACSGDETATAAPEEEPTTTEPPAEVKYCFGTRNANGRLGNCDDLIGERTQEDCCRQGGKGWTDRSNGKRCEDTCDGVAFDGPVQHCFGGRNVKGRCIQRIGEMTRLECCQDGGVGWSALSNGRDCINACEEPPPEIVHGGWGEWTDWSQCSVTCGEGTQTRQRTCDNPAPQHGGDDCPGSDIQEAICDEGHCPVHGGWGPWERAGGCSATCFTGVNRVYRQMRRECNDPVPQYGGRYCEGQPLKNVKCERLTHCPVDGGWSAFGAWSECSTTCEEGVETRKRTCTNPRPRFGGLNCTGIDTEERICRNRRICPIHGGWSDWTSWSSCDALRCGVDGTKFRSRSCTNPRPQYRGNYCIGNITDRATCSKCAGWSEWGPWGPCSGECRKGDFRRRFRSCNNPPPEKGETCKPVDEYTQIQDCHDLNPCPYRIDDEGSGSGRDISDESGDGSGSGQEPHVYTPCFDKKSCNQDGDDDETGFPDDSSSYSFIVVHPDVTPSPEPCVEFDVYSIDEYNDIGCANPVPGPGPGPGPDPGPDPDPEESSEDSYSFYGDGDEDDGGEDEKVVDNVVVQPNVEQQVPQSNGNSYSYSNDEDDVDNIEDGYSYSFHGDQGAANGENVNDVEDVANGQDVVNGQDNQEDSYSYSV